MTALDLHAAPTETQSLLSRLWDALPDAESVMFLGTGLGLAAIIAVIF
ncbi:MAG TPA: hypothetical protein VED40_18395 [Azospirillaceae bacterium]|jgi:hypothetical protein|nr:hypothetical protein [Azospirillaceae bacterium]